MGLQAGYIVHTEENGEEATGTRLFAGDYQTREQNENAVDLWNKRRCDRWTQDQFGEQQTGFVAAGNAIRGIVLT